MNRKITIDTNDFIKLIDLSKGELRILSELLKNVTFEGDYSGHIMLNASMRKDISKKFDISGATFNNALNGLSKKKFISRIDTNMYLYNKKIFTIK